MLYGVLVGLLAGLVLGGRLEHLAGFPLRWAPLALVAVIAQLVLFAPPVADVIGEAGAPLYVASSAAVLGVIMANLTLPGFLFLAAGSLSNLATIVANGGYMPASPDALAALGWSEPQGYSNSVVATDPALRPLTDLFAMPAWLPLANVFSIGDVLIGLGLVVAIVWGMRRRHAPGPPGLAP